MCFCKPCSEKGLPVPSMVLEIEPSECLLATQPISHIYNSSIGIRTHKKHLDECGKQVHKRTKKQFM